MLLYEVLYKCVVVCLIDDVSNVHISCSCIDRVLAAVEFVVVLTNIAMEPDRARLLIVNAMAIMLDIFTTAEPPTPRL